MKSGKVNTLTLNQVSYPDVLRSLTKPPVKIYYLGAEPETWLNSPKLAVVGSRKATAYGIGVTDKLVTRLAGSGVIIISGLAYGVDAAAHQAALRVSGVTVAVLPTPVTKIYPAAHRNLAESIIRSGGTLISTYREDSEIYRHNFIERNSVISGLADAVLITEAALRSGSLATARFALEQGKTVMAVPGNITNSNSAGCNNLIKSGAVPITEVEDIFFALGLKSPNPEDLPDFRGTKDEELVLKLIRNGLASQEEIALASSLDGQTINAVLTMLELAGLIKPAGGGQWVAV